MTEEQIAEINQGFAAFSEALKQMADVLMELGQIIADIVIPLVRRIVVFVRRYGFYGWLHNRLHSKKVAWWLAWKVPDSWVLKLPTIGCLGRYRLID